MLGNKEIMAANISRLMEERKITRNDICDALGFKYTTFTSWVKADAYPRIDKIEMMANYFGIQKKDLVEEYKPRTALDRLIEIAEKSSDEDIEVAISVLEKLSEQRRK